MGDDDQWRADGSFRGLTGGSKVSGGKGGGGKQGNAPSFNRVIPKFLQKYHQGPVGPAINTKFLAAPQPPGEEDGDDGELDDVQQAAIDEYMQKDQAKKDAIATTAGAGEEKKDEVVEDDQKLKPKKQRVAEMGGKGGEEPAVKKRKRKDVKTLSNKKLLSFSMDDEEVG